MTSGPNRNPFSHAEDGGPLKLEIFPVREKEGTKILPRRLGAVRIIWIVQESNRAPLSGGFTMRSAPTI